MKKRTTAEFILTSNKIHNNLYDYSDVFYKNNRTKVSIKCKEHGIFEQTPSWHLHGKGCPKCSFASKTKTQFEFLNGAHKIHNNKYDYSNINYVSCDKLISITCKIHGSFYQTPAAHLRGKGCSKCGRLSVGNKLRKSEKEFINKALLIHNNKYDYSSVKYIGAGNKVILICKKHGGFNQTPNKHLSGQGCPRCNDSKGEILINNILNSINEYHLRNFSFPDCKNKKPLLFDFYIPRLNICIEYDGYQHFKPVKAFGGIKTLQRSIKLDNIKNQYCSINNIPLLRIKFDDKNPEKILLDFIKNYCN